jgi:hypothetical protein
MMARKRNDKNEIVSCISNAEMIVDEALPVLTNIDGAGPSERADRTALRQTAFGIVLHELLDCVTEGLP